jgi:hypothetical protein
MKSLGMDTSWWQAVKSGKQDPWEKLIELDVNRQMVQYKLKTSEKPVVNIAAISSDISDDRKIS